MSFYNAFGLDEAEVLAELYNRALHFNYNNEEYDPIPMSIKKAKNLLSKQRIFNYIHGRLVPLCFVQYPRLLVYNYDTFNPIKVQECIENVRNGLTVLNITSNSPNKSACLLPRISSRLKISPKSNSNLLSKPHSGVLSKPHSGVLSKPYSGVLSKPYSGVLSTSQSNILPQINLKKSPSHLKVVQEAPNNAYENKQLMYKVSFRNMGIGVSYES